MGDNFIGYGPKMVIYDENMVIRQQGTSCKTVQINKTTHVSVMGKTIQLIDGSTGNVVQETRLNKTAINLHFSCTFILAERKSPPIDITEYFRMKPNFF